MSPVFAAALLQLAVSTSATGARAQIALTYQRGNVADACPDEARLKANIAARLGYDPFVSNAALQARAQVQKEASGYSARLVKPSTKD